MSDLVLFKRLSKAVQALDSEFSNLFKTFDILGESRRLLNKGMTEPGADDERTLSDMRI